MSASPWNLKINVPVIRKSAKDALFQMATKTLKLLNAPETIDFKVYKYNVVHKLAQEIEKLTEEKAAEILSELKKELQDW
jgi:hypothetical protein